MLKLFKPFLQTFNSSLLSTASKMTDAKTLQELKDIANRIRIESINSTTAAGSGHPTSSASIAEICSTLFFSVMKHDPKDPLNPNNDRFVLSKGHAVPALYATWAQLGYFKHEDLLTLRKLTSELEGHPTPRLPIVDVATGSLGQGLSCAAGMAYLGKNIENGPYKVYCVMGDGEAAEGSVWEAMHFAGHYRLDNLVAIFDVNRLGQSEATSLAHDVETYRKRADAFGFDAYVVDGNSVEELLATLKKAQSGNTRPIAIIAKTFKGKGIPGIEDQLNWHGKPLPADIAKNAVEQISKLLADPLSIGKPSWLQPPKPANVLKKNEPAAIEVNAPAYEKGGKKLATRKAYGAALVKLGSASDRIVALDCDVKNSTFSIEFMKVYPRRFVECFIAEQNAVGAAVGMGCRQRAIPFVSTFGTFFTRTFDQLRMGAISFANVKCVGSHVGVSIGEDGTSQMGLEDIALFRTLPGSTVFYPSDATSCEAACVLAANTQGICYIRTSRPETNILYDSNEKFQVGQAKVLRSGGNRTTLVGAGVTLHEALEAADLLAAEGIKVNVVDLFTVKPIDAKTIIASARETGNCVITVEEHYPEGGLGEAVLSALAEAGANDITVKKLCVRELPRSGKPAELVAKYGIGSQSIVAAVKNCCN